MPMLQKSMLQYLKINILLGRIRSTRPWQQSKAF
jgi:hypothetical protein